MQTPKSRPGTLEMPQRTSPTNSQTAPHLKTPGSGSNSVSSSPHKASRTPKDRSPKVTDRRTPRSPVTEKKRPSRVAELESQIAQLQKDLNKAKEQLSSSESWKRQAQREAEEAKKQLLAMSANFEECQQQLEDFSASEEARLQELRKISQDRDRAWESELEAVKGQHLMDSAALSSAMNEIQKLRKQLEMVAETESSKYMHADYAHSETQSLYFKLEESLGLVEKLKIELHDCKESESQALEDLSSTQMQLGVARATIETLKSEGLNAREAYNSLAVALEASKAQVHSLEGLVRKLQVDLVNGGGNSLTETPAGTNAPECGEIQKTEHLMAELDYMKSEVAQLRVALDAAEVRYQEEYIQSTLQIRNAYEKVTLAKSESCQSVAELEGELKMAKFNIEELNANLMRKETSLQSISEENKQLSLKIGKNQSIDEGSELEMDLEKSQVSLADLKSRLLEKDTELQSIKEENERLKFEIQKKEIERTRTNEEAITLAEAAKAAEREALLQVGYLTEETERNTQREARVIEQLNAAQASNSELEAELRRLKVHSDQLRKAAEAAAAMLSPEGNGKYGERTGSLDGNYHNGGNNGSPYFYEDMDDDSPKKKNGNMLKKIGVLWKKGQTQK